MKLIFENIKKGQDIPYQRYLSLIAPRRFLLETIPSQLLAKLDLAKKRKTLLANLEAKMGKHCLLGNLTLSDKLDC